MPESTDSEQLRGSTVEPSEVDALRRRAERYRFLLENTSEIVTILDPDGAISWQIPSFERILGVDAYLPVVKLQRTSGPPFAHWRRRV